MGGGFLCYNTHVDVRGQFIAVSSSLLPCGGQGLNSDFLACHEAPWSTPRQPLCLLYLHKPSVSNMHRCWWQKKTNEQTNKIALAEIALRRPIGICFSLLFELIGN